MKVLYFFFATVALFQGADSPEKKYSGSTPAGTTVRSFLGIASTDSIDFIRWKIKLQGEHYYLSCNYGVGQANTNGFIDGGKWIEVEGLLERKQNKYLFQKDGRKLYLAEVNSNLLHFLDEYNNLLVGNDGWSYTLNSETPTLNAQLNYVSQQIGLKDSLRFYGRTPCLPFAYGAKSSDCYKLKWLLVLFTDKKTCMPTTYELKGSVVNHEKKNGTWKIDKGTDGSVIFSLLSANNELLKLLVLDENIIVFTDNKGNILTGNEDFSYTLNRR